MMNIHSIAQNCNVPTYLKRYGVKVVRCLVTVCGLINNYGIIYAHHCSGLKGGELFAHMRYFRQYFLSTSPT